MQSDLRIVLIFYMVSRTCFLMLHLLKVFTNVLLEVYYTINQVLISKFLANLYDFAF